MARVEPVRDSTLVPTERLVERLRMIKDEAEIAILREAGRRISGVARELRHLVRPGASELEAAAAIDAAMRTAGFEKAAFETIVASGPNDDLTLTLDAETWKARVVDEREALADAAQREGGSRGGGVVRSVMPGIVREVRVREGVAVVRGQALVILEAMKMQNEVRADGEGTVSVVHVLAGTAVSKGDALVTIGPTPGAGSPLPAAAGGDGAAA